MERMNRYYLTRLPVAAGLGALLVALGQPWYAGVGAGVIALAFFLWASRGDRYDARRWASEDSAALSAFPPAGLLGRRS